MHITRRAFFERIVDLAAIAAGGSLVINGKKQLKRLQEHIPENPIPVPEKFKTYLNKNEPELKGEELKKRVDHTLECFTVYQEDLRNVHKLRDDLYKLMKSFNDDAKKIDQPSYNPVWGLSLEKIQDIRIFVH